MNAIVSVTRDWGIGLKGRLLVRNREDMRHFVRMTSGGVVLMGRTTFESLPGGPLKGRRNVILTHDAVYERTGFPRAGRPQEKTPSARVGGYEVYNTTDDALAALSSEDPDHVWLIGGASVYRRLLPLCSRAVVTMNDVLLPADAYFPRLDENPRWRLERTDEGGVTEDGVPFEYRSYVRLTS